MTSGSGGSADVSEEREIKLAVADGFVLPPLAQLDGVRTVDRGDQQLRAVYWDSDDLALAHAGVGVRHRNGVWTYKGRSHRDGDAVVLDELEVPGDGDTIPPAVRMHLGPSVDASILHPVVQLDSVRHHVDVIDGIHRAELVHDRVNIIDGERLLARFEEVEVEFARGSQSLAERIVQLLVAGGAVVDATPKYLRALRVLGHDHPR